MYPECTKAVYNLTKLAIYPINLDTILQNRKLRSGFLHLWKHLWCHELDDGVIKRKHAPRYWPFVGGDSPVTGEFPSQRPMTHSFDVFFDVRLNKCLSTQSRRRWFETPLRPLRRHRNILMSQWANDEDTRDQAEFHWHTDPPQEVHLMH